jgi:ribosomal protein L20
MKQSFLTTIRFLALTMVAAALAACSLATIAYNNASTVLGYALGDYVDLTAQQEDWLRARVEKLVAWHRTNELPAYRRTIEETRLRVAGPVSAEDMNALYESGRTFAGRAIDRALPDIAEFLSQLSTEQIAKLETKFAKENEKLAREARSGDETLKKKRLERYLERFEGWMGDLSIEQKTQIRTVVSTLPSLEEYRLADRKARQAEFLKLIKQRPEPAIFQRELRQLILQPELKRDPAYTAEWDRQQKEILILGATMVSGASAEQRQRIQKKLSGYANDISILLRSA